MKKSLRLVSSMSQIQSTTTKVDVDQLVMRNEKYGMNLSIIISVFLTSFFISTYELVVCQQPLHARMCGFGEKDRRPIDPPPIVQLVVRQEGQETWVDLQ
jgi:hypothetical protein